jgi:hypothetical protein
MLYIFLYLAALSKALSLACLTGLDKRQTTLAHVAMALKF